MKSRLVAYGRIQKGRHARCLIVVLDERLRCAGGGDGSWWHRVLRFSCRPAGRQEKTRYSYRK